MRKKWSKLAFMGISVVASLGILMISGCAKSGTDSTTSPVVTTEIVTNTKSDEVLDAETGEKTYEIALAAATGVYYSVVSQKAVFATVLPALQQAIANEIAANLKPKETTVTTSVKVGQGYFDGTYLLRIFTNNQVVTAFIKDVNGNYTIPYRNMVCSSGIPGLDTPHGTYYPYRVARWLNMREYGITWEQYVTGISGDYLFHSLPYLKGQDRGVGDPSSLSKWDYNQLGYKASHGCIRMQVADAKWIYDRTQAFVRLEIMGSSAAYPSVSKSLADSAPYLSPSDYSWDPTDPLSDNPWLGYVKPTPTPIPTTPVTTKPSATSPSTLPSPTPTVTVPTPISTITPTPPTGSTVPTSTMAHP